MLDTKATDKHSEYVIIIAFPMQQSYESSSPLRYTTIAFLVDKDAINFAVHKEPVQYTYLWQDSLQKRPKMFVRYGPYIAVSR